MLTEIEKWKKESIRSRSILEQKDKNFSKEQLTNSETPTDSQDDDINVYVFESNISLRIS